MDLDEFVSLLGGEPLTEETAQTILAANPDKAQDIANFIKQDLMTFANYIDPDEEDDFMDDEDVEEEDYTDLI